MIFNVFGSWDQDEFDLEILRILGCLKSFILLGVRDVISSPEPKAHW